MPCPLSALTGDAVPLKDLVADDARLGEHVCAFVRVRPGRQVPALPDVREHFERVGLARQKWPEEIRAVDDLPRTPSGKILRRELRKTFS